MYAHMGVIVFVLSSSSCAMGGGGEVPSIWTAHATSKGFHSIHWLCAMRAGFSKHVQACTCPPHSHPHSPLRLFTTDIVFTNVRMYVNILHFPIFHAIETG